MNLRAIAGSLLAASIGLLALLVALAGTVSAVHLIDPFSRISAFLSLRPHHPVQIALATAAIYLAVGLLAGALLRRLARAFDVQAIWPVVAFAVAVVGSVAVGSVLQKASPLGLVSSLLPHIMILLLATVTVATMPRIDGVRAL